MKTSSSQQLAHKTFAFKAEAVEDGGRFTGYASVFGNVDSYKEIVAPGAFSESLARIKASGDPLPVLWQHNAREPVGGADVLREDDKGLYTEGFLLVDVVQRAREAHALMKRRVVKGLSIGYYVEDYSVNEKEGIVTLKKLDLREYSVVTFPANTLAQVDSVKTLIKDGALPSMSEFEDFLRDVGGFSRSQAKAIAGHGLRKLLDQREAGGKEAELLQVLQGFKLPAVHR